MMVRVRHFAFLRERRGLAQEQVEIAEGATAAELYRALFGEALPRSVLVAVNQVYADAAAALRADDEVAFVPPVGGG